MKTTTGMSSFGSKLFDSILLGLGIAIVSSSTLILYNSELLSKLIQVQVTEKSEVIGETRVTSNDVRRRTRGSLSWFQLRGKQRLYNRDTIFTGLKSQAQISLGSDQSAANFKIADNTLIQLIKVDGEAIVDLQLGTLQSNLNQGEKIKVKIGENISDISSTGPNSSVQIVKLSDKESLISSESGQLNINTKGDSREIDPNKILKVNDNKLQVLEQKIKLQLPSSTIPLSISDSESIEFKWTSAPPVSNYKFMLARDPYFQNKIASKNLSQDKFTLNKALVSGQYFWRVADLDDPLNSSVTRSLEVINRQQFELIFPPDEYLVTPENAKKGVSFSWTEIPHTNEYKLQISRDTDFNEIFVDKSVIKTTSFLKISEKGQFYWRVLAKVEKLNEVLPSQVHKLMIGSNSDFLPPAEEITPPEVEQPPLSEPSPEDLQKLSQAPPPPIDPKPKPAPKPKSKPKVKPTIDPFKTADLTLQPIPNLDIKMNPAKPQFKQKVKIQWKASLKETDVELIWANNEKFEQAQNIVTKESSTSIEVSEPGEYFVKIHYLKAPLKPVLQSEQLSSFTYRYKWNLTSVKLSQPSPNLRLVAFGKRTISIFFEWQRLKFAEGYAFQLAKDPDFKELVMDQKSKESNVYFNETVPSKHLYWRVRYTYKKLDSPWSEVRKIIIDSTE